MKTFAYGALAPSNPDERRWALDELRRARRYQNQLVAVAVHERERMSALYRDERMMGECANEQRKSTHLRVLETRRALRKASGLGWGTYMLVEDAVKRATRAKSGTPRFRSHDGTGRLGATIPTGIVNKSLSHESRHCRIGKPDQRGHAVAELTMGNGRKMPLPIKLHRPVPAGVLRQAYVAVSRVGTRYVWGLRLVIDESEPKAKRCGSGTVAINFGWRSKTDGVRVAYAVGCDSEHHELVIPHSLLDACRHSESLRSIGDSEAVAYLGDARRRRRMRAVGLCHPAPQVPETRSAPWANSRHWALQDRHLYEWESDERAKCVRRRRALVLAWVQSIAMRYERIVVESFSLAEIIRRDSVSVAEIPEARHVRFMVAPGELREMVKREVGKERVKLVGGAMTMACSQCGCELVGDRIRSIELRCERCGDSVDQDANNAENQHAAAAAE